MPTIDELISLAQKDPEFGQRLQGALNDDPRLKGVAAGGERGRAIASRIASELYRDYEAERGPARGLAAPLDLAKAKIHEGDDRVGFWEGIGYGIREAPTNLLRRGITGEGFPDFWTDGTEFSLPGQIGRQIGGFIDPTTLLSFGLGGKAASLGLRAAGTRVAEGAAVRAAGRTAAREVLQAGGEAGARRLAARAAMRAALEAELTGNANVGVRLAARAGQGAAQLGAYGAVSEAAKQVAGREFDPAEIAKAAGREGALGAVAIGAPSALIRNGFTRYVAESLAFGAAGPAMEQRKPTAEDFASSFAFLGLLKGFNSLPKAKRKAVAMWGHWTDTEQKKLAREALAEVEAELGGKQAVKEEVGAAVAGQVGVRPEIQERIKRIFAEQPGPEEFLSPEGRREGTLPSPESLRGYTPIWAILGKADPTLTNIGERFRQRRAAEAVRRAGEGGAGPVIEGGPGEIDPYADWPAGRLSPEDPSPPESGSNVLNITQKRLRERMLERVRQARALGREPRTASAEIPKIGPVSVEDAVRERGEVGLWDLVDAGGVEGKSSFKVVIGGHERTLLEEAKRQIELAAEWGEEDRRHELQRGYEDRWGGQPGREYEAFRANELHPDDVADLIEGYHRKGKRAPAEYYADIGMVGGRKGMQVRAWAARFIADRSLRPSSTAKRDHATPEWMGWKHSQVDSARRDLWKRAANGVSDSEATGYDWPEGMGDTGTSPVKAVRAIDKVLSGEKVTPGEARGVITVAEWADRKISDELYWAEREVEWEREFGERPPAEEEELPDWVTEDAPDGEMYFSRDQSNVTPRDPEIIASRVAKEPKTFIEDIHEASRRLGAHMRYEPLPEGVMGYMQTLMGKDKVALRDIGAAFTALHELGHTIDKALFRRDVLGPLSGRLYPAGDVESGARNTVFSAELKRLSAEVRPWDRATAGEEFARYRDATPELMADFFALYNLDRAKARELSPEFTKAFEDYLPSQPEIKSLLDELHARDVRPTPGKPGEGMEVPTGGEEVTRPEYAVKQPEAKSAIGDMLKDRGRTYTAGIQEAEGLANQLEAQFARLPRAKREGGLEDLGGYAEGIENLNIKGDSPGALQGRHAGDKMFERAVKKYRYQVKYLLQEVNKYVARTGDQEYIKYLEDYLPHLYANAKKLKSNPGVMSWIKNSPNAKARKFPTLADAKEMGLVPLTQNAATLLRIYSRINWRVATNRVFIDKLFALRDSEGNPLAMAPSDAPADWRRVDHFALRRSPKYANGAAVHPDIYRLVRQVLEVPSDHVAVRALETFNAYAKKSMLSFSLFHHVALTESMFAVLGLKGFLKGVEQDPTTGKWHTVNRLALPSREGVKLKMDPDYVKIPAMAGLNMGGVPDVAIGRVNRGLMAMEARTRNVPGLGEITRRARQMNDWWDKGLWDHYHTGLKVASFYHLEQEWAKRNPEAPAADLAKARETIASYLNDAYGGLNWDEMRNMSPKTRQILHIGLLAPDWTFSNLRIAGRLFDIKGMRDPLKRQLAIRYWRNMIPTLAMSAIALQYGIYQAFGDDGEGDMPFPWQNEQSRKWDIDVTPIMRKMGMAEGKQRYYTHFGKQAREVVSWATEPDKLLRGKASPAVRTAWEQITGSQGGGFETPWARDSFWHSVPRRALGVAENFVPFSVRGNNFALTAPMRKGATPWKTRVALEKALKEYAEPRSGVVQANLDGLVRQILTAAEINGVNTATAMREATGAARGYYYQRFFAALEKQDREGMRKQARAIIKLHASINDLQSSMRERLERKNSEYTPAQEQATSQAYSQALRGLGGNSQARALLEELSR